MFLYGDAVADLRLTCPHAVSCEHSRPRKRPAGLPSATLAPPRFSLRRRGVDGEDPFLIGGLGVRLKNGKFGRASRVKAVFLLEAHRKENCEPRSGAGLSLRPPPGPDQIREIFGPATFGKTSAADRHRRAAFCSMSIERGPCKRLSERASPGGPKQA
jgi:hypothetical protein